MISDKRGPKCPMCNEIQDRLVPLYDNDQLHNKQQCCVDCKRKIRKHEQITPIDRSKLEAGA